MKVHYLTFGLILLLGICSCSKEDATPEPITKANITGAVNLYDEGTTKTDNSNMTITVEGSSPSITSTTNTNGNFTLTNVPFGTYTIRYEKTGYGTFKKFGIVHQNNATAITNTPSIGKNATTQITKVEAKISGINVVLSVTTNPAGSIGNSRYVRYFLSSNSNVSNEKYTYFSSGLVSQINPKEITLLNRDLINAGFLSGQTVYARIYGDSFWSNEYEDPTLSRKIFPNLNMTTTTTAVSFILP